MDIGNWPLVFTALDHVILYPDEYDQTHWYCRSSCDTFRCLAGWIAWFAGYRDVFDGVGNHRGVAIEGEFRMHVELAALTAMNLNPEIFGELDADCVFGSRHHIIPEPMIDLSSRLFEGNLSLRDILIEVRNMAKNDGVVPTPVTLEAMRDHGIVEKDEVFQ